MSDSSSTIIRERVRHDFGVRTLTVSAVHDLNPRMRRVTFTGPLDGFTSLGPGDHVKAFFPDPTTGVLNAPTIVDGVLQRPTGPVIARDYTPLGHGDGRLDLDFVLHGDEGPASYWAARATAGDTLVIAGPRGSHLAPVGVDRYVIGGDESALPAISRWLDLLPADAPVTVLIEVTDATDENYPLAAEGRTVHWLHRDGAEVGSTTLLDGALRALEAQEGTVFYWFGGEAASLVPVRRYLRRELGLAKEAVDISGYWKRGVAEHDHHAPVDPSDPDG